MGRGCQWLGVQLVRAHQHALRAFPMHDRHLNSLRESHSSLRYHADVILCFFSSAVQRDSAKEAGSRHQLGREPGLHLVVAAARGLGSPCRAGRRPGTCVPACACVLVTGVYSSAVGRADITKCALRYRESQVVMRTAQLTARLGPVVRGEGNQHNQGGANTQRDPGKAPCAETARHRCAQNAQYGSPVPD